MGITMDNKPKQQTDRRKNRLATGKTRCKPVHVLEFVVNQV